MKNLLALILLIGDTVIIPAQSDFYQPRSASMGMIQTSHYGEYAIFSNPAGLALLSDWSLVSFYAQPYGIKELTTLGLATGIPGKIPMAVSLLQFGGALFKKQKLGLSAALNLGKIRLGIRTCYNLVSISGFNSDHAFSWDLGIQLDLIKNLQVALMMINPGHSKIFINEKLPSSLQVGLLYKFHDALSLGLELKHLLGSPLEGRFGLEYILKRKILLRTGINLLAKTAHAGIGFRGSFWSLEYALILHDTLGTSHQGGLFISWN